MSSDARAGGGRGGGGGRSVRWNGGSWLRQRRRKWSAAELTGLLLFIASILLLVIGLLLTVLGFGKQSGDEPKMAEGGEGSKTHHHRHRHHQQLLLLQIAGPSCLSMTTIIWVAGCIFVRLWRAEQRQHNASLTELNDRLHLHAVARDLLAASHHHRLRRHSAASAAAASAAASSMSLRSPSSSLIAYDAQLKRLLSRHLQRHHKSTAADRRSAESGSRRGSHCSMVVSSKCRPSSLLSSSSTIKACSHVSVDAGSTESAPKSGGSHHRRRRSRAAVNGSLSIDSTTEDLEHFIIIHSKASTCSSLSLAGSRSSRTSSSIGSFFWDIQTPAAEAPPPPDPARNSSTSCRRRGSRDLNETKEGSVAAPSQPKRGSASMLEVSYHPLFLASTRRNSSSSCSGSKRTPPPGGGDRRPSWTAGTLSPPSAASSAAAAAAPAALRRSRQSQPSIADNTMPTS